MQLYIDSNYASPYAMSVFVALHEKKLPFEITAIDLSSGASSASPYTKISLSHRVPALVDGDFSLFESSAITEYLHEAYPGQALYPGQVKTRARVRQVQAWLRSDFMPIRSERTTTVFFLRTLGHTAICRGARGCAEIIRRRNRVTFARRPEPVRRRMVHRRCRSGRNAESFGA